MPDINIKHKYKQWNIFEIKYFWIVLTMTAGNVGYLISVIFNPSAYKFGIATAMILLSFIFIRKIKQSLTNYEREFKGLIIDPITNIEVTQNELSGKS